ncbi:MAG TPA: hypothetical protein ENG63_04995 [Candidatus Desulfofervidus auxilii]|uniref:Uncharacterized protein n=1 Tax=Desulfofervidus auxilii TaxID=1621989 RepID=A0A7C0U2H4_DESA2|nr:hypothetical protein [Candidatus Desulfofervidus auxilii]
MKKIGRGLPYSLDCSKCEYAQNHKPCNEGGSTYRQILAHLDVSTCSLLTNEWYKKAIKEIENKYKKGATK